jgi:hypothetical protein
MSPCFFTCISLPNGAKSVSTIRGGGVRKDFDFSTTREPRDRNSVEVID